MIRGVFQGCVVFEKSWCVEEMNMEFLIAGKDFQARLQNVALTVSVN